MTCRECGRGRLFTKGSVYCVPMGMIIREDHQCSLDQDRLGQYGLGKRPERGEDHGKPDSDSESGKGEAEVQCDSSGAA